MTTFTDLALAEPIQKALAAEGYTTPTPIQAQAIPHVAAGRDLLGIAQTGTGKTAAFALPILHRLATDKRAPMRKGCRALILSPTRELATQIAESFRRYGRHVGVSVAVIFGGVGHRPQIQSMAKGVDVLVATPGRLIDHIMERNVDLRGTEIFVLDEADQMLDLGFVKPIRRIVAELSSRRQNLFFSATMPGEIGKLADDLLKDPIKVAVTPAAKTVDRVAQKVIHVEQAKKRALLAELLADPAIVRALVFTRTKRGADKVAQYLETVGVHAAAIHGNKSQRQREVALDDFKKARVRVLVATDIAARGIDIDEVTHIIQFELPDVPEAYVHRIGRTARAGASGIAIALCDGEERGLLRDIERVIKLAIPAEDRRADASLAADAKAGSARPERGREFASRRDDRPDHRQDSRGGRRDGPRGGQRDGQQDRQGRDRGTSPGAPRPGSAGDRRPAVATTGSGPSGRAPTGSAGRGPGNAGRDPRQGTRGRDPNRDRRDPRDAGDRRDGARSGADDVWSNHGPVNERGRQLRRDANERPEQGGRVQRRARQRT